MTSWVVPLLSLLLIAGCESNISDAEVSQIPEVNSEIACQKRLLNYGPRIRESECRHCVYGGAMLKRVSPVNGERRIQAAKSDAYAHR